MQHVDEGQLHAYLDGELTEAGDDSGWLELHLEACPECRARMEGVRALRDRGRALLADPAPVAQPPFEVVLARSQRPSAGPLRLPRRIAPLAWAASVVVALGAGWLARDLLRDDGDRLASSASFADSAAEPMAAAQAPVAVAPTTGPAGRADAQVERTEAPRLAMRPQAAREPAVTARPQAVDATGDAAAAAASAEAASAAEEGSAEAPTAVGQEIPVSAALGPRREAAAVRARERASASAPDAAAWTAVDGVDAEARLGSAVPTVPGLRLLSTEISNAEATPVVRVRQALSGGRVLTLLVRGAEPVGGLSLSGRSAAAAAPPPPTEPGSVTARRGDLLLTATGPLPADSLRTLLEKVR